MELGNIVEFLENKTILVTGVTGFLAKIFIEKILRVQPNVKKLYLLLRAADVTSANERFYNEVLGKELFKVAKEKLGANLTTIISKKITVIPGDVADEDLGLKDSSLREEMMNQLDFVINFAATTDFVDRYDVALGTNTLGAKNVLCFAKSCLKLKLLVHISTAYVCGETSGLVQETPYHLGKALNGVSGLDIDEEKKLIDKKLNEVRAKGATEAEIKKAMKDMGTERAKTYGWPNTYEFTKAMGEMLVHHLKGNLPVVIIRPTIISSTIKEPFPGWIEGPRTIDALFASYGTGKLKFFALDLAAIVDVIPADMVINAIIVAMVAHANNQPHITIYHVGSSSRNPVRYCNLNYYAYHYFTNKPYVNKHGKPIKVTQPIILKSFAHFHRYVAIRYLPFLKVLKLVNTIFCHYFQLKYNRLDRGLKLVQEMVEIFKPYTFFNGIFEASNIDKLLIAAKENGVEIDTFFFDAKSIHWDDYFMNTHLPGLVKFVFK